MGDAKTKGRLAYARRDWADAFEALFEANEAEPLDAEDMERLAFAAGLIGKDDQMLAFQEQHHHLLLAANEPLKAARTAFQIAGRLASLGEMAHATGWVGRAQRLVEKEGRDCAERGYLQLQAVFPSLARGDFAAAAAAASEAAATGDRFGDADLCAMGRMHQGRCLIRLGQFEDGLKLLDEVMVAATAGEISPIMTGLVYCSVIAACQDSYAVDRAREWTDALDGWCRAQPQLVKFTGACLIHRSEILQLGGAWPEAFEEVRRASERLSGSRNHEATADSYYQTGEIHRLRGEIQAAESAYERASELGRSPQPGLALLRLAQGRADVAASALRRLLSGTTDRLQRARYLPAYVEVMLAVADLEEARRACQELAEIAKSLGVEILDAMAQHARGAVALAEGHASEAIDPLRRAQAVWQRIGAPYLSARIRVLSARACSLLGDEEGAALDREAARKTFTQLGAAHDLSALETGPKQRDTGGLSPRELEVLRLVASGLTNKAIGKALFVSEKTVDRHVSNIFQKLDVSSRAAATAWAYEHNLARG